MDEGAGFRNVYEDGERASSYSELGFPGTYYLAFRDLPELISRHVRGGRALDFGCGAGRSTRFVRDLGFDAVGVDISASMLECARTLDPAGDYRLVGDGDFRGVVDEPFELVLSAFTFDNIPTLEQKVSALHALRRVLAPEGRIVSVVSSPEIYLHEWASFSTADFPENWRAGCGDRVKIVMLDVTDRRPVEDVVCCDATYRRLYECVGLSVIETHRPLGRPDERVAWKSETAVAPWTIYVLGRMHEPRGLPA